MGFHIFITGGVMSSIGKGVASASLASLLQCRGFSVKLKKLDPYINVDTGMMSPHRHGEVFVMWDGCEADLDFGHYERFTNIRCSSDDSTTTGKIYSNVIKNERSGIYLGADIQVIPHITNEIKKFIFKNTDNIDFNICEIGGTVGDIEGLPYIETIRQMQISLGRSNVMFIHLSYLPYIKASGELKTKPTQHSVKTLQSLGIQPSIIVCRSEHPINNEIKSKLSMFCNVNKENVIEATDSENIYLIPQQYHSAGLDIQICKYFDVYDETKENDVKASVFEKWGILEQRIKNPAKKTNIAIVAKYLKVKDAYISLTQAIYHAGIANNCEVNIDWIDAEDDQESILKRLKKTSGIIIPGGFSERGTQNKMLAIKYARENNVPFFGICLGMQLSVIEACRNILKINANTSEFSENGDFVIDFVGTYAKKNLDQSSDRIGKMRLGDYECSIKSGSLAEKIYEKLNIIERHRHKYGINKKYTKNVEDAGFVFSGISTSDGVIEIIERPENRWFLGVQFHPEFKSRPFSSHPLFSCFIKETMK